MLRERHRMAKKRTRKVRFIVLMEVKGRNGTRSSFSKGSNSVRPGCDAVLHTSTIKSGTIDGTRFGDWNLTPLFLVQKPA